ncbi:Rv3654c family TadE-like protein [Cellulomonas sp. P5_C5]
MRRRSWKGRHVRHDLGRPRGGSDVQGPGIRQPGCARARRGEQGSGTVLLLALVAVALVVAAMLGLLASAQLARGRAQTAADLGALAGAAQLLVGRPGDACATVATVVRSNGARLTSCSDEGAGVVRVRVVVPGAAGSASASARAGPASARP